MRILVVEDDIHLAEALSQILKKSNYTVTCVHNGEDGLDFALTGIYDVIILDNILSKIDGITVLKRLRKKRLTTPVIIISDLGEISDKVTGLDSGADDYLVKPFCFDELLARIRALGRRKGEMVSDNILVFGDIELNIANHKLSTESSEVALTRRECELLEFLILRKGIISPKEKIIEKLWGFDSRAGANHVEVYISFLRKKLKCIGSEVLINTLRGAGYEIKMSEKI